MIFQSKKKVCHGRTNLFDMIRGCVLRPIRIVSYANLANFLYVQNSFIGLYFETKIEK